MSNFYETPCQSDNSIATIDLDEVVSVELKLNEVCVCYKNTCSYIMAFDDTSTADMTYYGIKTQLMKPKGN